MRLIKNARLFLIIFLFLVIGCGTQEEKTRNRRLGVAAPHGDDVVEQDEQLQENAKNPDSNKQQTSHQQNNDAHQTAGDDDDSAKPEITTIDEALAKISEKDVSDIISYLASPEMEGRGTGQEGGNKAAQYIADQFKSFGLSPGTNGDWFQKFSADGRDTQNVIGLLEGSDEKLKEEVVVIGGHYDHLGKNGDTTYFGADDNASGTTAVIVVARAISQLKSKLKRTVLFIAFSGEEMGLLGSGYYVENPVLPLNKTIYMINLDMIGYLDYEGSHTLSFLGGKSSAQGETLINTIREKYKDVASDVTDSAGGGSDHVAFIGKNIPSVFMHTGVHPYYHQPTDTVDRINIKGLTRISFMASELLLLLNQTALGIKMDTYGARELVKEEEFLDHGREPFRREQW